jgi:hypothetical protein
MYLQSPLGIWVYAHSHESGTAWNPARVENLVVDGLMDMLNDLRGISGIHPHEVVNKL